MRHGNCRGHLRILKKPVWGVWRGVLSCWKQTSQDVIIKGWTQSATIIRLTLCKWYVYIPFVLTSAPKNVSSWCILQHLFMLGAVNIVPVCKHSNVQSKLYISSYLSFSSRCEVLEVGLFMIEQLSTASIAWPRSAQRRGRDDHMETANPLRWASTWSRRLRLLWWPSCTLDLKLISMSRFVLDWRFIWWEVNRFFCNCSQARFHRLSTDSAVRRRELQRVRECCHIGSDWRWHPHAGLCVCLHCGVCGWDPPCWPVLRGGKWRRELIGFSASAPRWTDRSAADGCQTASGSPRDSDWGCNDCL